MRHFSPLFIYRQPRSISKPAWLLGLALAITGGLAQAQIVRCTDAKTGHVTYTNGSCVQGEAAVQVQKELSPEELARDRAIAEAALARNKEQRERDSLAHQERNERENRELESRQRAQARTATSSAAAPSESAECKQAQQRYNELIARESGDSIDAQERSQQALRAMEWACLGPATAQQLEQQRVLQPNAINRPWLRPSPYGYQHHVPGHTQGSQPPLPAPPSNSSKFTPPSDRTTTQIPSRPSMRSSVTRESSSSRPGER